MACQEWQSHGAVWEEPRQIRMMVSGPPACGAFPCKSRASPAKMSKTTPCKGAGGRRRLTPQQEGERRTFVTDYTKPTRRRMSARLAPSARSSRKPVARVDFDSFCPAASRISAWCR